MSNEDKVFLTIGFIIIVGAVYTGLSVISQIGAMNG